jgi:hypothetical protein
MDQFRMSRRVLLLRQFPAIAVSIVTAGCSQKNEQAAACSDAARLTSAEISLRASLQYRESSSDAASSCGGCSYYQAASTESACGNCQIVNGPVSRQGHCTSWTAKK